LGALVVERRRRLLEELDRSFVGDSRPPARVLVADRGPREQPAVAERPRDVGCRAERLQRIDRVAAAMTRLPELEEDLGAFREAVDAEPERGSQARGRLVEGERACGRACGEDVV